MFARVFTPSAAKRGKGFGAAVSGLVKGFPATVSGSSTFFSNMFARVFTPSAVKRGKGFGAAVSGLAKGFPAIVSGSSTFFSETGGGDSPNLKPDKPTQVVKWKKPLPPYVKLNTDASFDQVQGIGGIGGVFRDFTGDCSLAANKRLDHIHSSTLLEYEAAITFTELAYGKGHEYLHLEGDNKELFDEINSWMSMKEKRRSVLTQRDYGDLRGIKRDYMVRLMELIPLFRSFKATFVFREANELANYFASQASRKGILEEGLKTFRVLDGRAEYIQTTDSCGHHEL